MYGDTQGASCGDSPGYSWVAVGQPVKVSDEQGKTLGVGRIENGYIRGGYCILKFQVRVPAGPQFYNLTIASFPTMPYQADELDTALNFSDYGGSLTPVQG
ncbi:hypothetical protein ADK34_40265 [Streptomyces viridochromogenes]|uniref:Uncharacterized protein n=1 Tax=Streptomyces viridochromogenes TaxID=1938 RepID=A0A0L8J193_STRVR|nr:hypothetical protein ADK34_40265 [Streptomyces viridochromogenes]